MSDAVEEETGSKKNDPLSNFGSHLRVLFDRYVEQMIALRDIIIATTPHTSALDQKDARMTEVSKVAKVIPDSQRKEASDLVSRLFDREIAADDFVKDLFEKYSGLAWPYKLMTAIHQVVTREPRLPMLRNSLLTTAVSTFEVLITNVVTEFYNLKPEALNKGARDQEKEFTLRDLKQFDSIQDAIDSSIANHVEKLMFGGLSDWSKFFSSALKIDLDSLAIDWSEFQEILQRRHVIVHNGGMASRRYVTAMKAISPKLTVEEGQQLITTEQYLEYSIDHLLVAGILLVIAAYVKFMPEASSIYTKLNQLSYSLLRDDRWKATSKLCSYGMAMPVDQDLIFIFKVNRALAEKAILGTPAISEEIEAWDTSALAKKFKLAKACLLDDSSRAFNLLPDLIKSDEVTVENLVEWPLLANLRNDSRFTAIIEPKLKEPGLDISGLSTVLYNRKSGVIHNGSCRLAVSGEQVLGDSPEAKNARRCKLCWRS